MLFSHGINMDINHKGSVNSLCMSTLVVGLNNTLLATEVTFGKRITHTHTLTYVYIILENTL